MAGGNAPGAGQLRNQNADRGLWVAIQRPQIQLATDLAGRAHEIEDWHSRQNSGADRWIIRRPTAARDATIPPANILTITASAALAAPRQKKPPTINRPAPMSGAEWWQNKGNSEEMDGVPYRSRR